MNPGYSTVNYHQNRVPLRDLNIQNTDLSKKPSMFTKIKNEIINEKCENQYYQKNRSNSRSEKEAKHILKKSNIIKDLMQQKQYPSKYSQEQMWKQRNYYKRENIKLQSQLDIFASQNNQLIQEVKHLANNHRVHVDQLSKLNKQERVVQDFYEILRKQNDRLLMKNRELQMLDSRYLSQISSLREISIRIQHLQKLNSEFLQSLSQLQKQ